MPEPPEAPAKIPDQKGTIMFTDSGAKSQEMPSNQLETITPERAREYLKRNVRNRRIADYQVEALARDMASGQWFISQGAIAFDWDGNLVDGQHRLLACVRAGVPFTTWVVRGVDPRSMIAIDTGRKRTFADNLKIQGTKNYTVVAAVMRYLMVAEKRGLGTAVRKGSIKDRPTSQELQAFTDAHPDEVRFVQQFSNKKSSLQFLGVSYTVLAVLHIAISKTGGDYLTSCFFKQLADRGRGSKSGNPADICRESLRQMREGKRTGEQISSYVQAGMVVKAWNKWANGESAKLIKFTAAGRNPEKFPEIKVASSRCRKWLED